MSRFSELMDAEMDARGISTTALAKQLNVTPASISQYRHGKAMPSKKRMAVIINILNLDYECEPMRSSVRRIGVTSAAKVLNVSPESMKLSIKANTWVWAKHWVNESGRDVYWIDRDRMEQDLGVRVS